MKTIINTKELTHAVAVAANYTAKNGDFADKGLFSYKNENIMSIKATDFVEAIDIDVACQDLGHFENFSIDMKRLLAILKIAKSEVTSLEFTDKQLIVQSGRTKAKIDLLAETPLLNADSNKKTEFILTKEILISLKSMDHSIDLSGAGRPELTGMLMSCKDSVLSFVGTDTRRLCLEKHDCDADDFDAIVPKSALKTLLRCSEGTVVNISENDIYIQNDRQKYFCKFINGKYVDYRKVIPQDSKCFISIDIKLFIEIIKEASAVDSNIYVEIKNGKIKAKSLESDLETERDLETDNADIAFAVTAKYMLDYLSVCEGPKIQIAFNESLLPFMLIQSPTKFEVVMPININQKK